MYIALKLNELKPENAREQLMLKVIDNAHNSLKLLQGEIEKIELVREIDVDEICWKIDDLAKMVEGEALELVTTIQAMMHAISKKAFNAGVDFHGIEKETKEIKESLE